MIIMVLLFNFLGELNKLIEWLYIKIFFFVLYIIILNCLGEIIMFGIMWFDFFGCFFFWIYENIIVWVNVCWSNLLGIIFLIFVIICGEFFWFES